VQSDRGAQRGEATIGVRLHRAIDIEDQCSDYAGARMGLGRREQGRKGTGKEFGIGVEQEDERGIARFDPAIVAGGEPGVGDVEDLDAPGARGQCLHAAVCALGVDHPDMLSARLIDG